MLVMCKVCKKYINDKGHTCQGKQEPISDRFIMDVRSGIVAIYDTDHPDYDGMPNGCQSDYPFTVAAWFGYNDGQWKMHKCDLLQANEIHDLLNGVSNEHKENRQLISINALAAKDKQIEALTELVKKMYELNPEFIDEVYGGKVPWNDSEAKAELKTINEGG